MIGSITQPRRFSGSSLQGAEYYLSAQLAFLRGMAKKACVTTTLHQGKEKVDVEILTIESEPGQRRRTPDYLIATAMFPENKVATLRLRATQTLKINPSINE